MTPDPFETDAMFIAQLEQLLPQIGILGEFLLVAAPTIAAPSSGPAFHDSVNDILGVTKQNDVTRFLQRFEAANGSGQFHPVVRGVLAATG